MKIQFRHPIYPPAIVLFPNSGQTYLIPGWTPVPSNTKLSDIEWIREESPVQSTPATSTKTEWAVVSSTDASKQYTVRLIGSRYTCTCYGVRRAKNGKCKHITKIETHGL